MNTEPTEAQKEAGNYKKGHVQVGTFDITIEQPEGSIRRGTDADGKKWESKMHNTYGYFRGTEGVDGDHIDVFLSNDIDGWNGRKVFVVDQYNPDGTFDEHKVMLGFNDMDEAKSDYLANYEKGWENGRRITVSTTNLEDFEKWIDSSHRKTKPFSEYSSVNKETVANNPANDKDNGSQSADTHSDKQHPSADKGGEKPEKKQEKQSVFDKAKEIADKEEKKRKAEADKPKQKPLTEAERKDAEEVAGALGYRVEWVDTMEENGTIDADKKVIRIAKDAENPLVQVLGHEVAHGVRRMIGGKFRTLQKAAMEVVGEKEWNERIEKKRKLNAYAEGKLAEEVTCDIVGEALNDKDALKRLAESLRGEKGILARLRDAVVKMVEYFKNRGDKEGVRRMKAADKLLAELESALKEGVAPEQVKPEGVDHSVRSSKEMDEERLEIERKAKSDGTWLKAPNGKRTNLNERQWVDVRTKNFKEWFGDWENDPENASKIVDENGEPLMVFHYTWEDFTIFGEGKEIGASTFYNASDANYAATAAIGDWFTSESDLSDDMGKPMKVFLNIKNPSDGRSLEVLADEVGYEISSKDYEAFDEDRDNTAPIIEAGKNYQEKLRDLGYDGIFIADEEFGGTSYITFAPNQIKSAVENDGSYSPKENDIRRSVREKKEDEKTDLTAEERELRDNLVERMRKGGLDVVTDSEEMQRVIDAENERTRNKRSKKSEAARKRDEALYAVDWSTAFVSGKSREEATEIRRERGRKFKEETKELYGRVLSGNFDDVTLRLIDEFIDKSTPNNPYERPISKRLPTRALQKMRGGERTGSVDALFSRICESAVGKDGKTLPRAERERAIEEKKKELLKKWAIATGNWHTDVSDFSDGKEPIGSGTDSDVYLSKDGKSVIKVSKGKPYGKRFRPDVDNVALFNTVFPGSRYTIEGYGEIDGKFVRFLKQPFVDFSDSTPLTEGERVAYMEKLGFLRFKQGEHRILQWGDYRLRLAEEQHRKRQARQCQSDRR